MAKKRKVRVDLRKNRAKPPREHGWTREFHTHGYAEDDGAAHGERVRAKGDLSRRRTIVTDQPENVGAGPDAAGAGMPAVDPTVCLPGRVLRVEGPLTTVVANDGRLFRCSLRRLLRTLAIDERSIITVGDRVWIRPATKDEGVVERIEPRHGLLTRASRGREQVLVANVDQLVIVGSLAEPALKPHLIDRYLVSAEKGRIKPVVCLNKADLVDPADYQPLVGIYSQLGIAVLLTSATDGRGIEALRDLLKGRQTVFSGQSGVGKSSLLNAIQPSLDREVGEVSDTTQKGKHTTTSAELIQWEFGGWVVDTPGIRQFALWDVVPEELSGFFPEFRPFVAGCYFPGCTHRHEESCAVQDAVKRHQISVQRYETYLGLFAGQTFD